MVTCKIVAGLIVLFTDGNIVALPRDGFVIQGGGSTPSEVFIDGKRWAVFTGKKAEVDNAIQNCQ